MAKTRHFHKRMGQRGITLRQIELVRDYGMICDDNIVLDQGNVDELIGGLDRLRKDLLKLRDKNGLVVVESDGHLITTYNVDSFERRKHHAA